MHVQRLERERDNLCVIASVFESHTLFFLNLSLSLRRAKGRENWPRHSHTLTHTIHSSSSILIFAQFSLLLCFVFCNKELRNVLFLLLSVFFCKKNKRANDDEEARKNGQFMPIAWLCVWVWVCRVFFRSLTPEPEARKKLGKPVGWPSPSLIWPAPAQN